MCNLSAEPEFIFSLKQGISLAKKLHPDDVVTRAINQLYDDRSINKKTAKELQAIHYEPLKQAVQEGFSKPVARIEYGSPNYEMLKNLQYNTSVFAAFKAHANMKEMAALLKDDAGNLRTRDAFRKEALKVDSKYRVQHLNTEYDTAVRSSRMAAIWAKALTTARLYPNLKYLPSRAATPRKDHEKYYNLVLPIQHPLWNTIYPPNGFGCVCGVEPSDDDITDIPDKLPDPDKGFDFNSGKSGQVFDLENSSYIRSVPPDQQPALIRDAKKVVDKQMAEEVQYQQLYKNKNGGSVEAHPLSFDTQDFNKNIASSRLLAADGHQVKLLPVVNDADLRVKLIPKDGIRENKNPDAVINREFVADIKRLEVSSKTVIKHALDEARKQCNNAVIIVPDNLTLTADDIISQVKNKCSKKEMKDFGNIWIHHQGEWMYNPHKK